MRTSSSQRARQSVERLIGRRQMRRQRDIQAARILRAVDAGGDDALLEPGRDRFTVDQGRKAEQILGVIGCLVALEGNRLVAPVEELKPIVRLAILVDQSNVIRKMEEDRQNFGQVVADAREDLSASTTALPPS